MVISKIIDGLKEAKDSAKEEWKENMEATKKAQEERQKEREKRQNLRENPRSYEELRSVLTIDMTREEKKFYKKEKQRRKEEELRNKLESGELEAHCRMCDSNISYDAKRCPNCQFNPESQGNLSKGAAVGSLGFGNVITGAMFAYDAYKKGKEADKGLIKIVDA